MICRGILADPETILTREQTAEALTGIGYPIAASRLANLAHQGRGPAFYRRQLNGKGPSKACYRWGDALVWARANRHREIPDRAA